MTIFIFPGKKLIKQIECYFAAGLLEFYLVVRMLWKEQLPGQLDLCCLAAEVAQEAALLLDEERLGQRPRLGLQDFNPLLQLLYQVLQ